MENSAPATDNPPRRRLVFVACVAVFLIGAVMMKLPNHVSGAAASRATARQSAPSQAGRQGAPAAQKTAALSYTRFVDPFEQAFALDVPAGWTVKGGLFRLGYSDERPMVDMTSPDGKVNIRLGDVTIPTYATPNMFHREGQIYDLGAQAQMVAAHYRSGPEFVVLYSHVRFGPVCRNPAADEADAEFTLTDYLPEGDTPPQQTSTGQIAYKCDTSDGPRVAFAYVRTSLYGQIWGAPALASFLAPPDRVAEAREIILHAAKSLQMNPQWLQYQKQMDAYGLEYQRARQQQRMQALAQQVQQFQQKMQAMQNQVNAFERRQQAQSAQVDQFSQALRGVTPTTDPLTGESREVWTGPNSNYYANGLGDVVNSNTPPPGWHQLTPQ